MTIRHFERIRSISPLLVLFFCSVSGGEHPSGAGLRICAGLKPRGLTCELPEHQAADKSLTPNVISRNPPKSTSSFAGEGAAQAGKPSGSHYHLAKSSMVLPSRHSTARILALKS